MTMRVFLFLTCVAFISSQQAQAGFTFDEVNPHHSSVAFQKYVLKALNILANSESQVGQESLKSIQAGRVQVDELTDLTYSDFEKVIADFEASDSSLDLSLEDYPLLQKPGSQVARKIQENLLGFQWGTRIYIARKLNVEDLASTLVHEVNHVLNESHKHYEDPLEAFTEEYRAFYVEALFQNEPVHRKTFCLNLKKEILNRYQFENVNPEDLPDLPSGKLIPSPKNW